MNHIRHTKQKKSSGGSFEKRGNSNLNDSAFPKASTSSSCVAKYLGGSKLKQKQYCTLGAEIFAANISKKRKKEGAFVKVPTKGQPHLNMLKHAGSLLTTSSTKYVHRDILKRICAPKLEEDFSEVLKTMMEDVKQEFISVTHQVGVICVINAPDSLEGHITLQPFRLPGKTDFHETRLQIIKQLESRLFITFPLIRKILNYCVQDLPQCLIDFSKYRTKAYTIAELQEIFNEEIVKAKSLIRMWYANVSSSVRSDAAPVSTTLTVNYFSCGTGLMSVYLSEALRSTLEHLIDVTENEKKIPYLNMNLYYEKRILLEPSLQKICHLYVQLVDKISSIANNLPALEACRCQGYNDKLIPIFIPQERQRYYEKRIKCNIVKLFTPVNKYVKMLNDEFSGAYTGQETKPSSDNINNKSIETCLQEFDALEDKAAGEETYSAPIEHDISFEEGYRKVNFYRSYIDKLSVMVDTEYYLVGQLLQSSCRNSISAALRNIVEKISDKLKQQHTWENEDICEQFEALSLRALTVPQSPDELIEIVTYMSWANTELLTTLKDRVESSLTVVTRLVEMTTLDNDHIALNSVVVKWIDDIKPILEQNLTMTESCKFEFEERLQKDIETVHGTIKEFFPRLELLDEMDDADHSREYLNNLASLLVEIQSFDKELAAINKEEMTFKFPLTTVSELTELKEHLYPFHRLVRICSYWKRNYGAWMSGPFKFLDFAAAEAQMGEYYNELVKTEKMYRNKIRQSVTENHRLKFKGLVDDPDPSNHPAPIKLCSKTINEMNNFRPSLNMMRIMCNDALLQRHWDEMSEIAGFDMTPNAGTTLHKLMKLGLDSDISKYEIISSGAVKERQLLENLIKMQTEWDDILFHISVYKDTEINILTQFDNIQAVLDDHIIKTLTMRGSVFVKPFESQVKLWYEKIIRMAATLEEWSKVQSQWLHLLPIFSSKDIVSEMPEEELLFKKVNGICRHYMGVVTREPRVIETLGSEELLENLKNCIQLLEKVNEGTAAYLERKRLLFPRFFFLSNDDILEIVSETKDPFRIQRYLRKCFAGINELEFNDKLQIQAMLSEEGEKLEFSSVIEADVEGSNIDSWLAQVETQMSVSVRDKILQSKVDYKNNERIVWAQFWPEQIVIAVSQLYWTSNNHLALNSSTFNTYTSFLESLQNDLHNMVSLLRTNNLSNLKRISMKALIVNDVHNKDVTQELNDKKIRNDADFKWLAQLRYYWDDECMVRIINASIKYAYEYLGNNDRLVVTPLTERCYRTLIGAYHLNLNGAAEGLAGAGKTETVKDLSRALAVYCVVFNCSDGLDYKSMERFFKGLASAGAWACFDEFDRIEIEVLSVVAQQIWCIMLAIRSNAARFTFEGTELTLNPSCYVCITRNSNCASRSKLPDNLKVLFRTVTMTVPDYVMIAEISLYSYGFRDAKNLAVKIATVYRLCWEQLSSQNHYDFGMRAIKSVLTVCDYNKRKYPSENEDALVFQSIKNVNLPKFINHDISLFNGIISDLFPKTSFVSNDYTAFLGALHQSCKERNLQAIDYVITKIIETYEMMLVRHGFMLVGKPFAGKTSGLKVLSDILAILNSQGLSDEKVQYQFISPKSVTIGQLYGQFDSTTHEWSDGIVATCFRRFVMDHTGERKWIVFDGPVDAMWVENINTVLDDNKKLCLVSGEVILVTRLMSIIFEVQDLAQASPSTVSRCGMIYMEPEVLGWKPFVISWIATCTKEWCESYEQLILDLFDWLVPPSLSFISTNCRQLCNSGEINLVKSMMQIVNIVLTDACNESTKKEEDFKNMNCWIQATFIYAVIWGLGGILDTPCREKFDDFIKTLLRGQNVNHPYPNTLEKLDVNLPPEGLLFDYAYVYRGKGTWKYWLEFAKVMKVDEATNIQQVLIPTIDTVKYMHLVEMHIRNNISVLLVGPTGTGKSFYLQDFLMNKLNQDLYEPAFVTFTVTISANETQELLISKLNKRKRSHYGPPKGKLCVVFVDDLNMPRKDANGAQPPIELLRQYLDHKSWYDFKDNSALYLHDILLTGAMGPAGGSKQEIYSRFLRHFSIFSINEFSEESMSKIYTNILSLGFKNNGFPGDVVNHVQQIVAATVEIYGQCLKYLRPIPRKGHYMFNLRDCSRIIFGCAMLRKESADNKTMFAKIWIHEVLRVIYDRLIDFTDKSWLYSKIEHSVMEFFKEPIETVLENLASDNGRITEETLHRLMFGTYMDVDSGEEDKKYEEVTSIEAFHDVAMKFLETYNSTHKIKMNIVLFKYALQHLSKICRILAMPCGSALLVGISGSGRQSLTKLASAIAGHSLFQPNITTNYSKNDWHNDIKKVIKEAGGCGKPTVFLFTDDQIKEEEYLQDIDSLLNSGEVPNIFKIDEKQEILEMARLVAQGGNRNVEISAIAVLSFFVKRTREKLHIILCFSPVGPAFKSRLRLYPSLVNYCTINWFDDWPDEALETIAEKYIRNVNLATEVQNSTIIACKYFHASSRRLSNAIFAGTSYRSYITSAAYLELIESFANLTNTQQEELMANKKRYIGGLQKLEFASDQIAEMQKSLEDYQPQLKEMSEKAIEMKKQIENETIQVEHASALVRKDEEIANAQAAEAQTLKAECETDLAEAIPILEDAIAALNTLKPTDITVVKSMKNPPDAIKLVMAAVCVIKDVKPDRLPDPSTGRKILDYWGPSKRILGDIAFLQSLKDFDKDHIKPEIMVKIRKEYIPHKDFKPHVVAKASSAAEGLCKWIIAMDMYDKVAKEVAPKKEKLEKAEREYAATMAVLLEKKEQVTRLEKRLADLNVFLADATKKQQELQERVDFCENKLMRANKLIGGLGQEKLRWITAADSLQDRYDCLVGDILISCGAIAYLSSFTSQWRLKAMDDWLQCVQNLDVPVTTDYSFIVTMGSKTKTQKWYTFGLPQDNFSTENAIIQDNAKRWCLLIDPQSQANLWIRNMEKQNGIQVTKLSNNDYTTVLERCIEGGIPALIENIGENLETSLNSLLLKATYKESDIEVIELWERVITYHPNFKLYLTSAPKNAHYSPEVFNKVTIINFSLPMQGLEDQLLGILIGKEKPHLQSERENLIRVRGANKKALEDVENVILKTLSETTGDILENESAIQILDNSKAISADIVKKQLATKKTQKEIEVVRLTYKSVATHSAELYYCISDLCAINPMYQYSLGWFINLYVNSIETANTSRILDKRLQFLKDNFLYNLYTNVCRSLFDIDKLLFSFLLCTKIMLYKLLMDEKELEFFCNDTTTQTSLENPDVTWLSNKSWNEICQLDLLTAFEDFTESFTQNIHAWKILFGQSEPENCIMPHPWEEKLTLFQKLMIIKILRPDKVKVGISKFIENGIGKKFITSPTFDISISFEQSSCICPLVFILPDGTDALATISKFAKLKGYKDKFQCVSLGQEQGPRAEALVRQGQKEGSWICLQNCHLAVPWMTSLEAMCENFNTYNTNVHFRLWLTSCASDKFSISILHNSVKMTNESSAALKTELLRLYLNEPIQNRDFYQGCPGGEFMFTRMLYGIAFFHAVIQERKNFGSLGWNVAYDFNESDFNTSVQQLQMFINEYAEKAYEGIYYLAGECNYGGRVTDEWDRRLIVTLLEDYLNPKLVNNMNYTFSSLECFYNIPRKSEYEGYLNHIEKLPDYHSPEVFGLHANARITRDLQESSFLLKSIKLMQGNGTSNIENDTSLATLITDITSKLPDNFDVETAKKKYPTNSDDSMNIVLVQEMERFNKLLTQIRCSLQSLQKATDGFAIMTPEFDVLHNSLISNCIPHAWTKVSYPSNKSLPNYISDLMDRINLLQKWFIEGKPNTFWLPGFFFGHSFLAAVKQNYSRKVNIPIYQLTFDYKVLGVTTVNCSPENGEYIRDLFIEGARWDIEEGVLAELYPGIFNDRMPLIWIKPVTLSEYDDSGRYVCPLYMTSDRRGVLSTTGHSSNYVLPILLNTAVDPSHWIKRSVALLCQLD